MSEIPMEDDRDPTEPQARQEYEQWCLTQYEIETVEECTRRMKQFEEDFNRLFGGQHE